MVSLLLSFLIGFTFYCRHLGADRYLPSFSLKAIFAGIMWGLFEMGITFVLWLMALKTATRTANISTMVFYPCDVDWFYRVDFARNDSDGDLSRP